MGLEFLKGYITTDELLGYHLPAIRAWILRVLGVEPIGKVHPAIRVGCQILKMLRYINTIIWTINVPLPSSCM